MAKPKQNYGGRWSRQVVQRTEVSGRLGVVVSARREAAEAGNRILAEGGNAVDAAVSMAFVEAVVEPTDATLGGCGYMLLRDGGTQASYSIDFPAVAPLRAASDMFVVENASAHRMIGVRSVRNNANLVGPLSAAVPALVAGLCTAHARFGRLKLAGVLEPAIAAAEEGFEPDGYFALQVLGEIRGLRRYGTGSLFLDGGLPPLPAFLLRAPPGAAPRIRQPALATTLKRVAEGGHDAFYRGQLARHMTEDVQASGGILTIEDFKRYEARVDEPLRGQYRGSELLAPNSPCGSWSEVQALQILDCVGVSTEDDVDRLHVQIEALRRAFADRYYCLGDPELVDVPLDVLLGRDYTAHLANLIDLRRAQLQLPPGVEPWDHHTRAPEHDPWAFGGRQRATRLGASYQPAAGGGTTHLSVVDSEGTLVSCTHTAGTAFGSQVLSSRTGVIFGSAMVWFDPLPGGANSIAPGKRPLTNMGPLLTVSEDGRAAAIGAPGGRRIISAVTQIASSVLDRGATVQDAISSPRIDVSGREVLATDRLGDEVLQGLRARGHDLCVVSDDHEPYSYEFARPTAVEVTAAGVGRSGADPFTKAYAAAVTAPHQ